MTFVWSGGRELSTVKSGSSSLASYGYNSNSIRIRKTAGGVTTYYHVQDGVCYGESRSDGVSLQYLRDETGKVIGYRYQNTNTDAAEMCYFVFNAQGDVIQVVDEVGRVMANYTYDTWGKLISATNGSGNAIGTGNSAYYNPFLYRGYYYDYETGFYYLQSRYYDPVVGRFINADSYVTTGQGLNSFNMFAYCGNNPVVFSDASGNMKTYATMTSDGGGIQEPEIEPWWRDCKEGVAPYYDEISPTQIIIAYGSIVTKNYYKGWEIRIDSPNTNTNTKRHIHIEKGNKKYAQNEDGTPRDGSTGTPPRKLLDKLKEEGIWDWEGNKIKQMGISFDTIIENNNGFYKYIGLNPIPSGGPYIFPSPSPSIGFNVSPCPI